MKKIGIIITEVAVVALLVVGCVCDRGTELEPKPETTLDRSLVVDIPWSENRNGYIIEFAGYVMRGREGKDKGTLALSIGRTGDVYMLRQWYIFEGTFNMNTIVNVRADNLKPIAGGITIMGGVLNPSISYSYEEDGTLKIDIYSEEGQEQRVINTPADAYDDNELLFLLRAIPFEIGYTAEFTNVIPSSAQMYVVKLSVLGEEKLQVPAGSFDTYKVEVLMAGSRTYLWYAKEDPHYLIKLEKEGDVILLKDV